MLYNLFISSLQDVMNEPDMKPGNEMFCSANFCSTHHAESGYLTASEYFVLIKTSARVVQKLLLIMRQLLFSAYQQDPQYLQFLISVG